MVAANDAGAISTYTESGARYGTSLLWVLMLLLPVTYLVQEMAARLGIATGEGLASIVYKRFGVRWGRFFKRQPDGSFQPARREDEQALRRPGHRHQIAQQHQTEGRRQRAKDAAALQDA